MQSLFSTTSRVSIPCTGLILLLFSPALFGQEPLPEAKEYALGPVTACSADAYGHLYIARESGEIQKIDQEGSLLYLFSPDEPMSVDVLDATAYSRIFAFSRNRQAFFYLERNLGRAQYFTLQEVGFVEAAAPSADGNIWLVDRMGLEIVKYNPERHEPMVQFPVEPQHQEVLLSAFTMKEYQNRLFLAAPEGVLRVDALGNAMVLYEGSSVVDIAFSRNHLFMLQEAGLTAIDLYGGKEKSIPIPQKKFTKIEVTGEKMLLFNNESLVVLNLHVSIFTDE